MSALHRLARRWLPDMIRKPVGSAAGWFYIAVIRWVKGALFDLRGGRFETTGCTFVIAKDQTSRAYRSCFFEGSYEAEERALICEFLRPTDSVLELGACLGIVSCVTNKRLADKTGHVVVEGNPMLIPALHRNRRLNDCGFLIENCAVSSEREVTFFLHPVYVVGGSAQRESKRFVRVPGRSWRELDARYGPFTTLIIDVEGSELEVFEGSPELLSRYRLVLVELHEWAIGIAGVERCRDLLRIGGLHFLKRIGITEAWARSP